MYSIKEKYDMSDTVREALRLIADPDLAGKSWDQVYHDQALNPNKNVGGEKFCAVVYSNWLYATMAGLILSGDDVALGEFINGVADPQRLVRNGWDDADDDDTDTATEPPAQTWPTRGKVQCPPTEPKENGNG